MDYRPDGGLLRMKPRARTVGHILRHHKNN